MRMTRTATKASINRITKATGADKGILNNISESLSLKNFKKINIDILEDFPNHKFKQYSDEDLKTLAESIKSLGLLDPITVWESPDGHYYILCGHNRVRACKLVGIGKVECNVKKYENIDIARLAVIASNMERRGGFESLSIEEKCLVIVEEFETLKKLYKEDKEKYGVAEVIGFDAKKEVAIHYQLASTTANKFYKIGKSFKKEWFDLIPKHFNLKTAFQLAHLNKENLKNIIDELISAKNENEGEKKTIKISEAQAKELRQMEKENVSSDDLILFLYKAKKNNDNKKEYKIDFTNEAFSPYYSKIQKLERDKIDSIILSALSKYFGE